MPTMSFAGRFYCATIDDVMVVETSADQAPRMAVVANLVRPFSTMMPDTVHLVDNGGELMLVDRECNGSLKERKFKVYLVDLYVGRMLPVSSLGGRAFFIGVELALSVSPLVFPSSSANAIYLGFDGLMTGTMDICPIHLVDGIPFLHKFRNIWESLPNHDRVIIL
uniref:KIB1-4 beta-propeller domain-containing protein n=1 Tax=Oryza meridionalis TaxID=40149 RepID=A0A0E0C1R6_9ORYZ